jgi:hypothetical protein
MLSDTSSANENYMKIIDKSLRAFFQTFILNFGAEFERYCVKDPHMALDFAYLRYLFPKAKFILMLRHLRSGSSFFLNNIYQDGKNMTPIRRNNSRLEYFNSKDFFPM